LYRSPPLLFSGLIARPPKPAQFGLVDSCESGPVSLKVCKATGDFKPAEGLLSSPVPFLSQYRGRCSENFPFFFSDKLTEVRIQGETATEPYRPSGVLTLPAVEPHFFDLPLVSLTVFSFFTCRPLPNPEVKTSEAFRTLSFRSRQSRPLFPERGILSTDSLGSVSFCPRIFFRVPVLSQLASFQLHLGLPHPVDPRASFLARVLSSLVSIPPSLVSPVYGLSEEFFYFLIRPWFPS